MKFVNGFKLLFGIIFSIPLIIYLVIMVNSLQKASLAKNGTPAVATYEDSFSNVEVNGQPLYKIIYTFTVNGKKYEGQTGADYTGRGVEKIIEDSNNGTFIIRYNSDFKSIPETYKYKNDYWFLLIFGAVGVGFIVAFILGVKKEILSKKIIKFGIKREARYLSCACPVMVNGQSIYNVRYQYKNANGEYIEAKSPTIYSDNEAYFFQQVKTFAIKEFHGKSAIIENIDFLKLDENLKNGNQEWKRCAYCSSYVDKTEKRCPHCGGNVFE